MKFKSLKIKNFKQFIDEEINFSTDTEKNITLISGANATGKTTIIEVMKWCLFGKCNNLSENILNKKIQDNLNNGEKITIEVNLVLLLNEIEYLIKRTQTYEKTEQIKSINSDFNITSRNEKIENLNLEYFKFLFLDESSIFYNFQNDNWLQLLDDSFDKEQIIKIKNKSKELFNLLTSAYGRNIKDSDIDSFCLAGGEQIIFKISTILSIQNIVTEKLFKKTFLMPLIVDSVMSALNRTKMEVISKKIPLLTNQFIVLCKKDVESNIIQQAAINKIGQFYTLNPILSDDIYTVLQTQILEKSNGI